ncbi:MAG: NAD-dependent epimerase/dehydratase family protein [Armatimonadetes bacterium]|nr:NAD-dependent epimerase/dehydratase family protein [Armatimonadota bacterium]
MTDIAGMKVLVTGAHGFVAGHLIERLADAGADVVGVDLWLDRQSYLSMSGTLTKMEMHEADISDMEAMREVFEEHPCEIVMHLAAQADVTRAMKNPIGTFEANVRGTYLLLDHCRRQTEDGDPVRAIVVASSDKAYGQSAHLPYREDDQLRGLYPYDVSKACADMIARGYHAAFGLPVAVTRCANIYGPGDLNFNRIIPGTMRSLLLGERPVIRSDGRPLRDYMYVDDAVDGYLKLMEALLAGQAAGEAYNFGTGNPVSVLGIFEEMVQIADRPDLRPKVLGEAGGELRDQFISAARATRELGWQPQLTRAEGLRRTFEWYRENLEDIEV